jgi:Uma2 family endonuclease
MATRTATVTDDQLIILANVSWETYESLVADRVDQSSPRLTYDRGTLEIMSPSISHERDKEAFSQIVWTVAAEHGINFDAVGSMTYKQYRLKRGFEADSTFYLLEPGPTDLPDQIDGDSYRPPDLVIEIDNSRSSLQKLNLYGALRVPEVWRWDGEQATFYLLDGDDYRQVEQSRMVPALSPPVVTQFVLSNRSMPKNRWLRSVRDWARTTESI